MTRVRWRGAVLALLIVASAGAGAPALLACEGGDPVEVASRVKDRHQDAILAVPGVVGVGIGRASATGDVVIQVYVAGEADRVRQRLPSEVEGVPVEILDGGPFAPREG